MVASKLAEADALFVFCEGPHDIAFVVQVLRHVFGFMPAQNDDGNAPTFSQYPAPLNNLFQTNVIKHAQRDLSLDMAHKFFLPDMILQHGSRYVLLFHAGGKDNHLPVQTFYLSF